jgi:predicted nuclease of restriction endonuclease-like (RecB) superfamily
MILQLSWSHFRTLLQVNDSKARDWYMKECSATQEELRAEIEKQKELFWLQHNEEKEEQ